MHWIVKQVRLNRLSQLNSFTFATNRSCLLQEPALTIYQGDLLSESKPFKTDWYVEKLASKGRITEHTVDIYTWDPPSSHGTSYIPYNHVAPIYPDDVRVTHLVRLTADLSRLPEANKVTKKTGVDGKAYYVLKYHIKIQFLSAGIMEYSLWYKGRSYGSVSAEYI